MKVYILWVEKYDNKPMELVNIFKTKKLAEKHEKNHYMSRTYIEEREIIEK
ncbi:hypothetical protein AB2T85_06645 [Clostridium butyricum]|uniref:hypothetical protein n=1 Tax=Clostridium butyricum TaxID=1492 RepID=UPI0034651BEF